MDSCFRRNDECQNDMMLNFKKMHGCGNDFVVIDSRAKALDLSESAIQHIADRRLGIGCDQLVIIAPSSTAAAAMYIYNADGSKVPTCGNATRCVVDILLHENASEEVTIETLAGVRTAWREGENEVRVNMGKPRLHWRDIPLSEPRNVLHLGLQAGNLMDPVAVNMGNPHMVFFIDKLEHARFETFGKQLEHHPLFPQRANVSAVQVIARDHLSMRVWERGVGETLACGSAACAAVVAGSERDLCARKTRVDLPGGTLNIEWNEGGDVMMSGPVTYVFDGEIELNNVG